MIVNQKFHFTCTHLSKVVKHLEVLLLSQKAGDVDFILMVDSFSDSGAISFRAHAASWGVCSRLNTYKRRTRDVEGRPVWS